MITEILKMSACSLVDALKNRQVFQSEILQDLKIRHQQIDGVLNALPTTCFERAFSAATKIENLSEKQFYDTCRPLFGLPIPIKDSYSVSGVRTTYGSKAYENYIPDSSDIIVNTIEKAGGIVFAKSNTPEFEAGASTFNDVFGFTRNPLNLSRSVGGSSGGAAAAVAAGLAHLAQGSDFACSLRFPASFCGLVGLRPTPGLIPHGPSKMPFQSLSVSGPIARSVADIGLALDAFEGSDKKDPLSGQDFAPNYAYRKAGENPKKMNKFAFSMDLNVATVSTEVKEVVSNSITKLEKSGCNIRYECPNLLESHFVFDTLRAFQFATLWSTALINYRDKLKPEVVWNIERGLNLDVKDLIDAERKRSKLRLGMIDFLNKFDFLITPTAPVAPPPYEDRYVQSIEGIETKSYIDWLALGYAISVTGCPAVSIPCGFTSDGLPVGIQIVALPHREKALLSFAAWVEQVFALQSQLPMVNIGE
tara:strand:+ start:1397 stop:2830 length:1434 start_codon:yes stop_codon:yes gene_type:complete